MIAILTYDGDGNNVIIAIVAKRIMSVIILKNIHNLKIRVMLMKILLIIKNIGVKVLMEMRQIKKVLF